MNLVQKYAAFLSINAEVNYLFFDDEILDERTQYLVDDDHE
jgi:hypothetical protein